MGGPLEKVVGRDTDRLLSAYHQAELELEAGPGWMPYREGLTAGLAFAARHEGIPLPDRGEDAFVPAGPGHAGVGGRRARPGRAARAGLAAGHLDQLRRRPVRRYPAAPAGAVR